MTETGRYRIDVDPMQWREFRLIGDLIDITRNAFLNARRNRSTKDIADELGWTEQELVDAVNSAGLPIRDYARICYACGYRIDVVLEPIDKTFSRPISD